MGFDGDPLARPFVELGFGVEQIEAARPTFHEQPDDAFGPRRKVARPWSQRTLRCGSFAGQQPAAGQQIGQGQVPNPPPTCRKKSRRLA